MKKYVNSTILVREQNKSAKATWTSTEIVVYDDFLSGTGRVVLYLFLCILVT